MVIVMSRDASDSQVQSAVEEVLRGGAQVSVTYGQHHIIVAVIGDAERLSRLQLEAMPGVSRVMSISTPYKLVSMQHHTKRSTVMVGSVPVGPDAITLFAGPCAVESPDQTLEAARMAQRAGATILRGGAFKPRTSPYAFQGLGLEGLKILADVRQETGMPVVTEVVDIADVDAVVEYADMLQIGARNMQNFALLNAVAQVHKPIMLKRGMTATIEEWLLAAEYLANGGSLDIILCERGIRTFETATRNTLDISAVPVLQNLSHLPVIVDPSHSGGKRDLVLPLARAGLAVGADGLIIDVHPDPANARCDGPQALASEEELETLRNTIESMSDLLDRNHTVPTHNP